SAGCLFVTAAVSAEVICRDMRCNAPQHNSFCAGNRGRPRVQIPVTRLPRRALWRTRERNSGEVLSVDRTRPGRSDWGFLYYPIVHETTTGGCGSLEG